MEVSAKQHCLGNLTSTLHNISLHCRTPAPYQSCDNRTVYRECADFVCCCKALQGLAGNLTDAFSSDQTETSAFFCEMLCNTHHVTTHNDSQLIVRTLVVNIELDICEVHYMKADWSTVFCYLFCQIYNFLFCSLAGVWRSVRKGKGLRDEWIEQ